MARIRTIKPEYWTDEKITECSHPARLLFIGLWNFADDHGGIDASPKQIKMRIFPADNIDVVPLLVELNTHGLLIEYSVNDKKYFHIKGFREHQVINRPSTPKYPVYEDSLRTHGILTDYSLTEGKGREGKGRDINLVDKPQEKVKPVQATRFIKPSAIEVQSYMDEIGYTEQTGEQFVNSNDAKGWLIGTNKTPAKDWKAMVRTWNENYKRRTKASSTPPPFTPPEFGTPEYREWVKTPEYAEIKRNRLAL